MAGSQDATASNNHHCAMAQRYSVPPSQCRSTATLQHRNAMAARICNGAMLRGCDRITLEHHKFAVSHYCNGVTAKCRDSVALQQHTVAILSSHGIVPSKHRANQQEMNP
jgi:hypothetical protein